MLHSDWSPFLDQKRGLQKELEFIEHAKHSNQHTCRRKREVVVAVAVAGLWLCCGGERKFFISRVQIHAPLFFDFEKFFLMLVFELLI